MTQERSRQRRREMAEACRTAARESVAARFGVTVATVAAACREHGVKAPRNAAALKRDRRIARLCRNGMSQAEAAALFGVSRTTASKACRRNGFAPGKGNRHRHPRPSGLNWLCVDWTKHDTTLAEELGVSRERVRQKRKELGKPKRPRLVRESTRRRIRERFAPRAQARRQKVRAAHADAKSVAAIAATVGANPATVALDLKAMGLRAPGRVPRFERWDEIDWALPLARIAQITGYSKPRVSAVKREMGQCKKRTPAAEFAAMLARLPERFGRADAIALFGARRARSLLDYLRSHDLTIRLPGGGRACLHRKKAHRA